jgi:hypothetical protein
MTFFWLIAAAMAAWTISCLISGRIRLRGWRPIDRSHDPGVYWLFIAGFVVGTLATIWQAIDPPY